MTRHPLFILGSLSLCSAGILLFLVLCTKNPNDQNNGFTRQGLRDHKAVLLHELSVGEPLYKMAGNTAQRIFFTGKDPRILHSADLQLNRLPSVTLPFPLSSQLIVAYDIKTDSPWVRLYANNLSAVFSARLDDTTVHRTILPTRLFTALVRLPSQSLILRAFDSTGDRQLFKKIVPGIPKPVRETPIIESSHDAGFSADGMLRYDSGAHRLLYIQYYQNRFFCMDTNLNLLYTGKTIDTTNTNPIHTRTFTTRQNRGSLMPAVPLHIINRACTTDGVDMYVLSALKADNEDPDGFDNNTVVDVYALSNGAYKRSFYIPDLHYEKAQNIMIAGRLLLVSYTGYIGACELPRGE